MLTAAELREMLEQAERAERNVGQNELKELKQNASFEWRVTTDKFGFRVECRYDQVTIEAITTWRVAYPKATVYNWREPSEWHGMSYRMGWSRDGKSVWIDGRGGSIILALPQESWPDPAELTVAQAEAFMRGEVPDELKKPW